MYRILNLFLLVFGFLSAGLAKPALDSVPVPNANTFRIRIKLNNPTYATYTHALNPYNKSLVSVFEVDDSPKTIYNLMYPYFKGGVTAGGYVSSGVKSTDGCGNLLHWTMSAACFIQDVNGNDLLSSGNNFITWPELSIVTAPGPGLQRGFDYMNHAFGGPTLLGRDRYQQIYLNNKTAFEKLGYHPESLVVPDVQIGYRFGSFDMGMDVTSQAGVQPLWDDLQPMGEDATAQSIYENIQNPIFIRRNHWQEVNNPAIVAEHKQYLLAAYNKSLINPRMYAWFSHGPGEIGNNNFAYYREVIEYLQSIGGDNVIGLSLDQYLGYQKTRYAAEHGSGTTARLTSDGYLDISFDLQNLKKTVRNRLLTLLVNSDSQIQGISWSNNIKAVTYNPVSKLVNIQLQEIAPVDPSTLPVRPIIIGTSPKIEAGSPNTITFSLDRSISQSKAEAWTVSGNTVLSVSELSGSSGTKWRLVCANNFLANDVVDITYKAQQGDAVDVSTGLKMLTYSALPVLNQSQETKPEEPSLAISIRRDSDNIQLATFNTIAEVRQFMTTLNINANISIVFNREQVYSLASKWTLKYNNSNYTLTIKGKDGLATYPVIDCNGATSDPFRVDMSHVRFDRLKIRSGKYSADGAQFGDNYSGAIISQQANTSDVKYTNLILHQGMRGIKVGAGNGTIQPNISDVKIEHVVFSQLTGAAIQVGSISGIAGEPETRPDDSYKMRNVSISDVTLRDELNQSVIENSGALYFGQIEARGIDSLIIRDVVADQNQKQPIRVSFCKNVLIDRAKLTNSSLNTNSGYKGAIHVEGTSQIVIQNTLIQQPYESIYITGSTGLKLYYNTFDVQKSNNRCVSLFEIRKIIDVQGNLFISKGDAQGRGSIGASFYKGNGYSATIATDFASEKNNLFATDSYIIEFSNLNGGNGQIFVRSNNNVTFSNYKATYSRGQGSEFSSPASVTYSPKEGVSGYLAHLSAGRNLVTAPIASIDVDLHKTPRSYPTDVGAYDRGDGIASTDLSQLSIPSGNLSPAFDPAISSYSILVPSSYSNINLTLAGADANALIYTSIANGPFLQVNNNAQTVPLTQGLNNLLIRLSAEGIADKTYSVAITRATENLTLTGLSTAAIAENQEYSAGLPTLVGIPYTPVNYSLSGSDAFRFTVDHQTGEVKMIPRNFESPSDANGDNTYEVTLNVKDASNVSASRSWTVNVTNSLDPASFDIAAIEDVEIEENVDYTSVRPILSGKPVVRDPRKNFSIVPVPDTQHYTGQVNGGLINTFKAQTHWITNQKDALNIKYVSHLGDIVQNGDNNGNDIEWRRADTAIRTIENPVSTQLTHGIPYGLNVGNHDQSPDGNANGTTTFYNSYFGSNRYAGRDYYGGHYGTNNDNNYQLFSASGLDFLVVNLEFDPLANPDVLTWADGVLKANPTRRAIIASHYILNPNGTFGAQGQAIYDKLKVNANLFLMLCGHRNPNGEARRTDTFNGNTVHTILSDYQDRPNGGDGWLRFMEFLPSQNKIAVATYSPTLNRFENDENSRFILDYDMSVAQQPGDVVYSLDGPDASRFTVDPLTGIVKMVPRSYMTPADANGDNSYWVNLTAKDADGNAATRSWTVRIIPEKADADSSLLNPLRAEIVANGQTTKELKVTLRNKFGTTLTRGGAIVQISKVSGSGSVSTVTDHNNGTYTAVVTSPASIDSGVFVAAVGAQPIKNGSTQQVRSVIRYIGSDVAELTNLVASISGVTPAFSQQTLTYSASVGYNIASVDITADRTDINSKVLINGVQVVASSYTVALIPGGNSINVTVVAQNGIVTKTYTINIHRKEHPFPYSENFRNTTADIVLGGSPNKASLTAVSVDKQGSGYLRLTNNAARQMGFAHSTVPFPVSQGLAVSFEYYVHGGTGGDGLSFFLYDPTGAAFQIGGPAGSLGYAQSTSNGNHPGLGKGFLGIGFDETGNFSNPIVGRQGGPGSRPNSVVLRGDGNGPMTVPSNYEYLKGIQTTNAQDMTTAGAGSTFTIAGMVNPRTTVSQTNPFGGLTEMQKGYRKALINLVPNSGGQGFTLNVHITEGNESGAIVHHMIKDFLYTADTAPAYLSYGFASASGDLNNFHEIRNLEVTLPRSVEIPPTVAAIEKNGTQDQSVPFSVMNFSTKFVSLSNRPLTKVLFPVIPPTGLLKLNGSTVNQNQEIDAVDLDKLVYVPIAGYTGSVRFEWKASDGTVYSDHSAEIKVVVVPPGVLSLPYAESFRNSTASRLVVGGNGVLTAASGFDAEGAGYLRLTSNATQQLGFARNTAAFPLSEGLNITFEYFSYGGNGADGITFFLYDSSANSSFQIGAKGGSLGYAQNVDLPGVSKGYLGFGFDEFGNFSNAVGGRAGGVGQKPSSLTLRGDGNGTGSGVPANSNYKFLFNAQTSNAPFMSSIQNSPFQIDGKVNGRSAGIAGLTENHTGYRKAQIELRPNGTGLGYFINVWITEGHPGGRILHHLVKNFNYFGNTVPQFVSYGFAAGTGSFTNVHEIRNLDIRVPGSYNAQTGMSARSIEIADGITINKQFRSSKQKDDDDAEPTNLVSLNWDGKNDHWIIRNIDKYPNNSVRVFNMKGAEVFNKKNYRNDWDGTVNGAALDKGTYYYIVDLGSKQIKGYISILK